MVRRFAKLPGLFTILFTSYSQRASLSLAVRREISKGGNPEQEKSRGTPDFLCRGKQTGRVYLPPRGAPGENALFQLSESWDYRDVAAHEIFGSIEGTRNKAMQRGASPKTGFSLVEVALALGVSAFCLIAILGLLPVGLKSSQAALEQTAANGILSAVATDLRATPPTSPPGRAASSQQFGIPIPAHPLAASDAAAASTFYFTSSGKCLQTPSDPETRYRLTVHFLPNATGTKSATFATLQVSWPAPVPPEEAAGSAQIFLALDRN